MWCGCAGGNESCRYIYACVLLSYIHACHVRAYHGQDSRRAQHFGRQVGPVAAEDRGRDLRRRVVQDEAQYLFGLDGGLVGWVVR